MSDERDLELAVRDAVTETYNRSKLRDLLIRMAREMKLPKVMAATPTATEPPAPTMKVRKQPTQDDG